MPSSLVTLTYSFLIFSCVILYATSNDTLKRVQSECKDEKDAYSLTPANCTVYKELLICIARVNTSFVNEFVHNKKQFCEFSPEFISKLQGYHTQKPLITTTQQTENHAYKTTVSVALPLAMSSMSILYISSILRN
ncbi:uncharacterized protein LOC115213378 [Argonauta hians]